MAEKSDMSQAAKGSSRLLVEERKVLGRNSVADGIAVWGKAVSHTERQSAAAI